MIFSDRYTEVEKYSIFRQEHICSSATMPWLYTGLVQERYEPELSSPIKERLNAALDFTPFLKEYHEPARNELKKLTVDYNGDTHLGYNSRFIRPVGDLGYNYFNSSIKYFKEQTRSTHLIKQYDEMYESIGGDAPQQHATFVGFKHDVEGVPTHLGIHSSALDLSAHGDAVKMASYLSKLRNWSQPDFFFGEETLNIVIGCAYAEWVTEFNSNGRFNPFTIKTRLDKKIHVGYDQVSDKHIEALIGAELLTVDQAKYVYSLLPGMDDETTPLVRGEDIFGNQRYLHPWQYMLDFEYIYKDGTIDDIIVYRFKYKEFKEIEVLNPDVAAATQG